METCLQWWTNSFCHHGNSDGVCSSCAGWKTLRHSYKGHYRIFIFNKKSDINTVEFKCLTPQWLKVLFTHILKQYTSIWAFSRSLIERKIPTLSTSVTSAALECKPELLYDIFFIKLKKNVSHHIIQVDISSPSDELLNNLKTPLLGSQHQRSLSILSIKHNTDLFDRRRTFQLTLLNLDILWMYIK